MSLELEAELLGDEGLERHLDDLDGRLDLRPAWDDVARVFTEAEERQFLTEGAAGGTPWAPLSPRYAAWKAIHFPGKGILRRTDALFRSLTQGPETRDEERHSVTLGSTDPPYGRFHKRSRPPVAITEANERAMMEAVREYVRSTWDA